jgi:ribosomal protein S17E
MFLRKIWDKFGNELTKKFINNREVLSMYGEK